MTAPFPENARGARGYRRDEVDDFLAAARAAFEHTAPDESTITAATLRETRFTLVAKHGYSVSHVDEALHRLEDAFALRESERHERTVGRERILERARRDAQNILEVLERPARTRFDRVGRFSRGYRTADVDAFAQRISDHLMLDQPLTLDEVHAVTFRSQRGGYREGDVDTLLDELVAVMIAVI